MFMALGKKASVEFGMSYHGKEEVSFSHDKNDLFFPKTTWKMFEQTIVDKLKPQLWPTAFRKTQLQF